MSIEQLLATTVSHSPEFNQALALGRIHSILSALIEHCRTSAGYLCSECFTCELQIRSQGDVFVLSVPADNGVKAELLQAWGRIQGTDVLVAGLISPSPPPLVSEPRRLRSMWTTEPFVTPDPSRPQEPSVSFLSWVIAAPFIVYYTFSICHNIYLKILPIAIMIFEVFFFFCFVEFALLLSLMFCVLFAIFLFSR